MNTTVQNILTELKAILEQLDAISEKRPLSLAYNNFGMAGIDIVDMRDRVIELGDRINNVSPEDIPADLNSRLLEFIPRLNYLRTATIPHIFNGNGVAALPAFLLTMDALDRLLRPVLSIRHAEETALVQEVRSLRSTIRSLTTRSNAVKPTIERLQSMADSIVSAHEAAVRLPTDLQELEDAQDKIDKSFRNATATEYEIRKLAEESRSYSELLLRRAEAADSIVEKCETAMRASTAVGLAGAFNDRAEALTKSIFPWVGGLVSALLFGAIVGGMQLHLLAESIQASTAPTIVWTRLAVSLLSVGAPVWFAWLSTKQIGQRFRLSEDYAYKASISKAYEGYRREAVELDEDFQKKLFASALTRLDEQPLRFVESETHGSPWHEFLSSDVVKDAIRLAPELLGQWTQKAADTVAASKKRGRKMVAPANDGLAAPDQATQTEAR
ncbi:hypothetical protein ACW910_25125 (plasmid) [Burkholderia ambifaria]